MRNKIPVRQDQEAQLKLLRARTHIYSVATRFMVLQLCLTVVIPVAGAIWGAAEPHTRPYFAILALLVLLLDPLWIDRQYKATLKQAAKIAEQFDCIVLEIGWNPFVVGDTVEAEDVHRAAKKYESGHDDSKLVGWYPKAAGELPLHLARLVCQRTNLRYDSELRRHYAAILGWLAAAVVVLVLVVGVAQQLRLPEWVLNLALLSPLLSWSIREFYRQRDTADQLQELMKTARKLWERCLTGEATEPDCTYRAREFQDAIYSRRTTSPLVIPLVYSLLRPGLEDEMNEAATDFLAQYQQVKAHNAPTNSTGPR
jgi:hypothetical protein